MEKEQHTELKQDALFWLHKFILTTLPEGSSRTVSPSLLSHDIAYQPRGQNPIMTPNYFRKMTHSKIARLVSHELNRLVGKGELFRDERGDYRRTTVLEKLAKLGG